MPSKPSESSRPKPPRSDRASSGAGVSRADSSSREESPPSTFRNADGGRQPARGTLNALKLIAPLVLIAACAEVVVHKIPTKSSRTSWSDIDQKAADKIEGFRYYLPRPYVAVKYEFPFDSSDRYVLGTLSPDQRYLLLDPATLKAIGFSGLDKVPSELPVGQLLHADAAPQTALSAGTTSAKDGGAATDAAPGKGAGGPDGGSGTGVTADLSSTSNGLVELPGSPFDIVYLPDFDEQYAVKVDGKFSNADLKMALGNGWMLSSVDEQLENGALGQFLMDQIGKTLDVVRSLGGMKLGLPSSTATTPSAPVTALSAGGNAGAPSPPPVVHVLVRVRTITYVVPGLYPVLKPQELVSCRESMCGDIMPFHKRTERFFEVVRVDAAGAPAPQPAGAGPDSTLKKRVSDLLKATKVDVVDAQLINGQPRVTIRAKKASDKKAATKDEITKTLQKAPGLSAVKVCWQDEDCGK